MCVKTFGPVIKVSRLSSTRNSHYRNLSMVVNDSIDNPLEFLNKIVLIILQKTRHSWRQGF